MNHLEGTTFLKILQVAAIVLLLEAGTAGQSLESKLAQKAAFIPEGTSALAQLIEVAQYYKIPMGIEWVDQASEIGLTFPLKRGMTVQELISVILKQHPGYQKRIDNGVLHITNSTLTNNPKNFLNLRIPEFGVNNANLLATEASLRLKVHMTLHPKRYARGFNGGYGYGVPREDSFDLNNITFSGHNLTVREILNKTIATNGNALWIVHLIPSKMMTNEPFFAQGPLDEADRPPADFHWQFVALDKVKTTR